MTHKELDRYEILNRYEILKQAQGKRLKNVKSS